MSDRSGKTEEPTHRRLEKARREGQFPSAKEFVSSLQFLIFVGLLGSYGRHWLQQFGETSRAMFRMAYAGPLDVQVLTHLTFRVAWVQIAPLAAAGMSLVVVTLGL